MAEKTFLSTIPDINFTVPDRIGIGMSAVKELQEAMLLANKHHLAVIYYCINCKSIINFVTDEEDILHCAHCGKKWSINGN